jgi:isocitrate/isopropylmalate dehydrogenase
MATYKLLLLAGDGIGPEVMAEVKRLLGFYAKTGIADFQTDEGLVGGACYDAHKVAITDETMAKAQAVDAVIFGAVEPQARRRRRPRYRHPARADRRGLFRRAENHHRSRQRPEAGR